MKFDFFSKCKNGHTSDKGHQALRLFSDEPTGPAFCGHSDEAFGPGGALEASDRPVPGDAASLQWRPDVPDIAFEGREERVAALRQQVHDGTYEIPFSHLVRILAALFRGTR